jgi:endogenous inhibitor of DNA gyrase (YacG/DUF329 family)
VTSSEHDAVTAPEITESVQTICCAVCQVVIPADAPLWRVTAEPRNNAVRDPLRGVCEGCRDRLYTPTSWRSWRWTAPAPCVTCGRLVGYRDDGRLYPRYYVACSERCRHTAHTAAALAERQAARSQLVCGTCGQTFTAARSDGRYCSPACRQRAYRQRQRTETQP